MIAQDQITRTWAGLVATTAFLLLFFGLPVNTFSPMQRYYSRKLRQAFLTADDASGAGPNEASRTLKLADLQQTAQFGGPVQLFVSDFRCGAKLPVSGVSEAGLSADDASAAGDSPASKTCTFDTIFGLTTCETEDRRTRMNHAYLYTPLAAGSLATGFTRHSADQKVDQGGNPEDDGSPTVATAVTNSGAAVSPAALAVGPLRWVLLALNLRLGEWIFNPVKKQRHAWWQRILRQRTFPQPRPCHLFEELVRSQLSRSEMPHRPYEADERPDWLVASISDGGFVDFLGLNELLRRRCRVVMVIDSSVNEGGSKCLALGDAIRAARIELGCEIVDLDEDGPLDLSRLQRDENGHAAQHMLLGRILYPQADDDPVGATADACERAIDEGLFVYVPMTMTGDEDVDVTQFANMVPSFPDHPTSDQFFRPEMVESYRQLGQHTGEAVCRGLPDHDWIESQREPQYLSIEDLSDALVESYRYDCREIRVDRRDDLRRLPSLQLPSNAWGREGKIAELSAGANWVLRVPFATHPGSGKPSPSDPDLHATIRPIVGAKLREAREFEEKFLVEYEHDSRVRQHVRLLLHSFAHEDWHLFDRTDHNDRPLHESGSPRQCVAYVLAAHDFSLTSGDAKSTGEQYINRESGGFRVSDGRDMLLGGNRFQAGGRLALLTACGAFSAELKRLAALTDDDDHLKSTEFLQTLLLQLLVTVSDSVFRYRGLKTAILVVGFLEAILVEWMPKFAVFIGGDGKRDSYAMRKAAIIRSLERSSHLLRFGGMTSRSTSGYGATSHDADSHSSRTPSNPAASSTDGPKPPMRDATAVNAEHGEPVSEGG